MVTPQSPSRMFNGLDEDTYKDAKFAHEINDKMRVPKRIKATGEYSDEDFLSNQNGIINAWNRTDKIDMNVPDRILVLGDNEHLETRSAPLEIQLENSLFNKGSVHGMVRVNTPPRIITLNDHHFPSASDADDNDEDEDSYKEVRRPNMNHDAFSSESDSQVTSDAASIAKRANVQNRQRQPQNHDISILSHRDGTPTGEITLQEEMLYFRRQIAKLNRRILDIEIGNEQRAQRDKIVYCLGLAYFVMKAILWLKRD